MKVGFQIARFDARRGGAEMYVHRFVRRLLGEGHGACVFATEAADPPAGCEVRLVRPFAPGPLAEAARASDCDVIVGTSGDCGGCDVVQLHGGTLPGTLRQNAALIRNPILRRLSTWFEALRPKRRRAQGRERELVAQAPRVIALSNRIALNLRTYYDVSPDRLDIVPNGIDTDAFAPERTAPMRATQRRAWGLGDDTACLLLMAHNVELKGLRELLDAAAIVARSHADFRIVVVGRGTRWRAALQARRLGIRDRLMFAGALPDPLPAWAAADVCVHPTWYDPCSLSTLEALACGLPVITTSFNGVGELMTDGREGFVIDTPANTAALADRIAAMMDARERRTMSAAARELALRCGEHEHFQRMMTVFAQAVRSRQGER